MLICRNCATFFPSVPNFRLGKRTKKRSYLTSFSPTSNSERCSPLPDERIALLPLRCVHRASRSRQLQHGCVLAFAQPGEQHGLPVGELKRIVMHTRLADVDLPELRHFLFERDLRAG